MANRTCGDCFSQTSQAAEYQSEDLASIDGSAYLCFGNVQKSNPTIESEMTEKEIIQIENEIYTKIVMDEFKRQRAEGVKEYLLDKYEMDKLTKEQLKKILTENKS